MIIDMPRHWMQPVDYITGSQDTPALGNGSAKLLLDSLLEFLDSFEPLVWLPILQGLKCLSHRHTWDILYTHPALEQVFKLGTPHFVYTFQEIVQL